MNEEGHKMDSKGELEVMQYLTFVLAGEEYGISILKVQEIRSFETATRIPGTPEYLLGVINLRGSVVPIVDLGTKFDLPNVENDAVTVIILVKILTENGESTIGLVVDAVSDVYDISTDDISKAPDITSNHVKNYVTGLATVDSKMIILLDIDALVNTGVLEADVLIDAEKKGAEIA